MRLKRSYFLVIIVLAVFLIIIAATHLLFGTAEIETSPPGALVKIDGQKEREAPITVFLRTGLYEVEVSSPGYVTKRDKIKIDRSYNYFSYRLNTNRQELIKKLPMVSDDWSIFYNKTFDSFRVVVNSEPYEELATKAENWLLLNGVDTKDIHITGAAGVGPDPGGLQVEPQ